jgi:hypothetical protein
MNSEVLETISCMIFPIIWHDTTPKLHIRNIYKYMVCVGVAMWNAYLRNCLRKMFTLRLLFPSRRVICKQQELRCTSVDGLEDNACLHWYRERNECGSSRYICSSLRQLSLLLAWIILVIGATLEATPVSKYKAGFPCSTQLNCPVTLHWALSEACLSVLYMLWFLPYSESQVHNIYDDNVMSSGVIWRKCTPDEVSDRQYQVREKDYTLTLDRKWRRKICCWQPMQLSHYSNHATTCTAGQPGFNSNHMQRVISSLSLSNQSPVQ